MESSGSDSSSDCSFDSGPELSVDDEGGAEGDEEMELMGINEDSEDSEEERVGVVIDQEAM